MFRFQMQLKVQHAILFLQDASAESDIPEQLEDTFVTATANCLCFRVMSEVDGASVVTVTDADCGADGREMFSGVIRIPTNVLTVADSAGFHYLNIPILGDSLEVSIRADDDCNPEWVWIHLAPTEHFEVPLSPPPSRHMTVVSS